MPGAGGGQRAYSPRTGITHDCELPAMWVPELCKSSQVLLITEPPLQPPYSVFLFCECDYLVMEKSEAQAKHREAFGWRLK